MCPRFSSTTFGVLLKIKCFVGIATTCQHYLARHKSPRESKNDRVGNGTKNIPTDLESKPSDSGMVYGISSNC